MLSCENKFSCVYMYQQSQKNRSNRNYAYFLKTGNTGEVMAWIKAVLSVVKEQVSYRI